MQRLATFISCAASGRQMTVTSKMLLQNSLAVLALQGNFCLSAAPLSDDYGSHLRDGDCVTYISAMEYFIYCCCYVDGGRCAYTNNDRAQMFTTRNKPIWERHAELWLMKNVRRIDGRIIGAQLFTYRDFLFSEPSNCLMTSDLVVLKAFLCD